MTQVFSIMILIFVLLAIVFLIKIKSVALQLVKSKEVNNQENQLEKNYQFIKGLY
ncbi:hypothetical protein [Flavobacterium chungangense]|uniref:Uncharacterized protein n=1 Tax=Flavobacterium chungangense TaxID=554283 RepID=A0A6V6Z0W0_9FLAO|nr:hypothetical protein [Flavobacterium chungangense]CAD0005124.1 hypothetical protein FLACHUCJ7_02231 [Flavobacterium chungangense]